MKRLINNRPQLLSKILLGALPFIATLIAYLWFSGLRLDDNPDDKLMPSLTTMLESIGRLAFEPSKRTGEYVMWGDTQASLLRLLVAVLVSAAIGLTFGLLTGSIPLLHAHLAPYITILSLVPPMAILPVLLVLFGIGEISKIMLIVIGIAPFIIRDLQGKALEIPTEQLIKAQTLGASTWQVVTRVVLPQILPRLFENVRLSLGSAWLFLIAAEAIAAENGLGYRIFLVRRYMSMDVILPYVVWITLLAFALDWMLRAISRRAFPWFHQLNGNSR